MTVASFAEGRARRAQRYGVAATIEGLGSAAEGLWFLCDHVPAWAAALTAWRPWLVERPSWMAERVDPLGGGPDPGEVSFDVLDRGALISAEMGFERDADAALDADLSATATTATFDRTRTVGSRAYIGAECLVVGSLVSGTTYNVTRAALGTEAQSHDAGDAVRILWPYDKGRRIRVYVYPLDGVDATTLRETGTYYLDQLELDDTFTTWSVRGLGQLQHLSREVGRVQWRGALASWDTATNIAQINADEAAANAGGLTHWWPGEDLTLRVDDEIIGLTPRSPSRASWLSGTPTRGLLGTTVAAHAVGASVVQVFAANRELRLSRGPSPSTSRSSGVWTRVAHWIDIIMILATSSADADDGLELLNFLASGTDAERTNWSSLPPGVGIGQPIAGIDVAAALDVQARTADALFEHFHVGSEGVEFGELITEHFLRPLGAYLSTSGERAVIKLPRTPLIGGSAVQIGPAQVLRRKVGKRRTLPRLRVSRDLSLVVGSVTYTGMRTAAGAAVEYQYTDQAFAAQHGRRGYYGAAEGGIEIEAPSVRASPSGGAPALERAAFGRLFRFRRAPLRLSMELDDEVELGAGDIAEMTIDQVPNFQAPGRGVTAMPIEVLTVEPELTDEDGSILSVEALGYGSGLRVGRVSASGRASAGSTPSGGNVVVSLEANVFTAPDATGGLPTTDAAAFTVGDFVRVVSAALVPTGAAREVLAVGTNSLTLAGSTAVSSGAILTFAAYADQSTRQRTRYVSFADRATLTVGASGPTWHYGEP